MIGQTSERKGILEKGGKEMEIRNNSSLNFKGHLN
jgi:hypothetical protein